MTEPANRETEPGRAPTGGPPLSAPHISLHPFFRVLLFLALGFCLLVLVNAVAPGAQPGQPRGTRSLLWYAVALPAALLESWLFLHAFHGKSYRALGLWFYRGWGRELATGAAIGAGLLAIVAGGLAATRGASYHGVAGGDKHALAGILATGGWLALAAAFEEIVFRGYLFQRMVNGAGPIRATAVFSAAFAVAHLLNPFAATLSTVNTFLSGVLLSVAYLKTRALWLPIGLHWAWNFCQGPIFSLPVSGLRFTPTLLRVELTGSPWLTGGAYGPEGGVVLTVATLAATFWLARTRGVSASPAAEEALK